MFGIFRNESTIMNETPYSEIKVDGVSLSFLTRVQVLERSHNHHHCLHQRRLEVVEHL